MARESFAAKLTSIWIGAFFFWIFKGFKGSFKELITKEYESRNVIVGYIITLIVAIIIIYLIFIKK
jgi:hypothetical protein